MWLSGCMMGLGLMLLQDSFGLFFGSLAVLVIVIWQADQVAKRPPNA
jgi:tetrahydromethanopterin S-methyltransferase subunit C